MILMKVWESTITYNAEKKGNQNAYIKIVEEERYKIKKILISAAWRSEDLKYKYVKMIT